MKRVISWVLLIALLLSMSSMTAFAAENSTLVVSGADNGKVVAGSEITAVVTIKKATQDVNNGKVRLTFNKDVLEATEISQTGAPAAPTVTTVKAANKNGWLGVNFAVPDDVPMSNDWVVTVKFTVLANAATGNYDSLISVDTENCYFENSGGSYTATPVFAEGESAFSATVAHTPITDPNAITATVAAPVKGQALATTATVADDAPYTVDTDRYAFLWFEGKGTNSEPVTGSAKPDQVYTVRLTLKAKDGESFDVASLNGKTNTAGWAIVTLGAPGASTCEKLWLVKIFEATGKAAKLGGKVTISGTPKYNQELTAVTTELDYAGESKGTLGYRWMRDDKGIANAISNTYTTVEADIGCKITVEVVNSKNIGSVISEPVTIGKADYAGAAPAAPTVDEGDPLAVTDTSITLTYTAEGDYDFACVAKGGNVANATWQPDKTFGNLQHNTEYDFYARVRATNTTNASAPSAKVTARTAKSTAPAEFTENTLLKGIKAYSGEYDGAEHDAFTVSLPEGWSVQYARANADGVVWTDSVSKVRNVADSAAYIVKFTHDDYNPVVPTQQFEVKVTPKDISLNSDGKTIVFANYDVPTYTGSAVEPTNLKLFWAQGKELDVGTDVTIAYSNNINRPNGTITVTAKADGNFTGSCPVYFNIRPMTITPYADSIASVTYTGGKLYPRVTVRTEGGTALVQGEDYEVSYTDNIDVGTGTATIRSISDTVNTSNYTFNEFPADFQITRAKFPNSTIASMNVRSNEAKTGVQYKLPTLMNVTGATYGTVTTEGELITNATLGANDTLTFNTSAKPAGTTGTIKVTITEGKNYEGATFVLTVTAKDKDDADVSITDDTVTGTVTYGRTFTATATAATPGEAAGSWTWESSDPSILKIVSGQGTNEVEVKAVKASNTGATLTAKYSSETHEDTATTNAYTVAQQPIAVAYIDLKDREYDGTLEVDPADIDTSGMSIGGKFAGDDVSVIVTSGSYDEKNAGSRTAELDLELDGTAKGNYYLPVPTYTVENAKITPKPVTISGATVAPSKEYDGTTNADITSTSYTVDGAVDGDKVSVDAANAKASYESKDFGTGKTVTFSGFSLTGDDAKNYNLTAQPTTTADITKRTLTVTSITVADKTYDGGTDAQIANITYGNIVSGDQVYARILASFADANAGTNKTITFDVKYLEGKDAGNYQLIVHDLPAATATIRKAQLVGAPTFDKVTKAGTKLSEVTYDLSGIKGVNGEDVSPAFSWTDAADTVIEANKSYSWTISTTNTNYESPLTGSTVLYPVSTSYSEQVKKQSEEFEAKKRGELPEDELDFRDVYEDDYFFDAVQWAAENGITGGVGNDRFGPNLDCSRGQTMTFLWRASGEPEPDSFSTDLTDVKSGDYFYEAVLWAMEEGITTGAGAGRFAPDATVTRGQFVTFLYRLANASSDGVHPFADVPAGSYYEKAIAWAFAEGITRGTSGTTFSPDAPCTRAQIITFLYRYFNR